MYLKENSFKKISTFSGIQLGVIGNVISVTEIICEVSFINKIYKNFGLVLPKVLRKDTGNNK